ncbi:MAG TPA: SDR family NAD(P)-dependent oxidoreductase, partial [Pyrinomonadaceae bacterium]|nr:SDR family NAD(P)-dependent oxidoreductase [Pyrinomonadaceae bacterium]
MATILERFRLDGKVALVTGASAGLGAAIAVALAEAGADVAAHGNSRTPDATCARVESAGRRAFGVRGDLGDKQAPRQLVEQT